MLLSYNCCLYSAILHCLSLKGQTAATRQSDRGKAYQDVDRPLAVEGFSFIIVSSGSTVQFMEARLTPGSVGGAARSYLNEDRMIMYKLKH